MKKILQVQGGMNKGGVEAVIMGWYRNIDRSNLQFDFTTMTKDECPHDKEIREKGGNIIYVPSRGDVGNIKHCYYLYKCIKENGPYTAVHSHMNFHGGVVALISKIAGVKNIVIHAHNTKDDGKGFKRKIEIFVLQKLLLSLSNNLTACGVEAGKFIFGEKSNFEVINNSVDTDKFKPRQDLEIEKLKEKYKLQDTLILGHIGRFSEQKNHKFIISIIDKLRKKGLKFKIILIGDGELKEEFFKEIDELGLNEYVLYLGLQDDIDKWLNVMDLFIFPSLYEGLPVVLVEAQATGLPCMISNNISNEVDLGLSLIDSLDIVSADEWADKIIANKKTRINDIKKINEKMKENGFSLKENTNKMIDIYTQNQV